MPLLFQRLYFSDTGVCMYICHDDLYHVLEKLPMISFDSSSEATTISIRETGDWLIELYSVK